MRVYFSCAAALVFAVVLFAACNSNDGKAGSRGNVNTSVATNQQAPPDGVTRITPAELKAELDQGVVVLVDTRSPDAYNVEHIKGAINIVDGNLDAHLKDLPANKKIVAYCS